MIVVGYVRLGHSMIRLTVMFESLLMVVNETLDHASVSQTQM